MISLIKDWFGWFKRNKEVKKYSTTMTKATEGSDKKYLLSTEITSIINKINANKNISNIELNKISSFYFNTAEIPGGVFKLNEGFTQRMVFEIKRIDTVSDKGGDISNIVIGLNEITFNNEMYMSISVKDFNEIFQQLRFDKEKT